MDGVAIAQKFFDAAQAGDLSGLAALVTRDCVVWHNYDRLDISFELIAQGLAKLPSLLTDCVYSDRRYAALPDGAVLQHSLRGVLPDGQLLDVPMMVRMRLRDGRICRFEEYLDRADMAPLVTAISRS